MSNLSWKKRDHIRKWLDHNLCWHVNTKNNHNLYWILFRYTAYYNNLSCYSQETHRPPIHYTQRAHPPRVIPVSGCMLFTWLNQLVITLFIHSQETHRRPLMPLVHRLNTLLQVIPVSVCLHGCSVAIEVYNTEVLASKATKLCE